MNGRLTRTRWAHQVRETLDLSRAQRSLALDLADQMRTDGTLCRPRRQLARSLRTSPAGIDRLIRALTERGLLVRTKAGHTGQTSEYLAVDGPESASEVTRSLSTVHKGERVKSDAQSTEKSASLSDAQSDPESASKVTHQVLKYRSVKRVTDHGTETQSSQSSLPPAFSSLRSSEPTTKKNGATNRSDRVLASESRLRSAGADRLTCAVDDCSLSARRSCRTCAEHMDAELECRRREAS